jgi:hypothetical protein
MIRVIIKVRLTWRAHFRIYQQLTDVMAYVSVSVNIPSIVGQTPGSIDQIFLWLIGGDYRKVPIDDQLCRSSKMATTAAILDFSFSRLQDKRLGLLIRFLCGSLGVTRGRFLLMISSAARPRWLLRPLSWISFPSIEDKCLGRLIQFFCGSLGVTRGRFLSMISSAAHPRWPPPWILVSVDFLSNTWVDWSDFLVVHWG